MDAHETRGASVDASRVSCPASSVPVSSTSSDCFESLTPILAGFQSQLSEFGSQTMSVVLAETVTDSCPNGNAALSTVYSYLLL